MNLMVQGTASYSGKSFLAMALCRVFADKGYKVAPFKAQNTSLNSFVTRDGKEISRAQALQALAAGIEPTPEMNPILVKPKGDSTSQVVVNGSPYIEIDARDYYEKFALKEGLEIVGDALETLQREYELIIIEGAGSPAEINLYHCDIANMRIADMADAEVILIADIDRGGVFASIYGTVELLKPEHKHRVKGVVINKFRGDVNILNPGLEMIENKTHIPVLGVIPYITDLELPGEDSLSLEEHSANNGVDIAVIRLPRISNFTDFDPLAYDGARVRYVAEASELGRPEGIIIPGTKNTMEDLKWLREKGFADKLKSLAGTIPIIGICGGYQILGKRIIDNGIEGNGELEGLGLLDVETRFEEYRKVTKQVEGKVLADYGFLRAAAGESVAGYEIHMGKTILGSNAQPLLDLSGRVDGAMNREGTVFGTYLHGIFDSPGFRKAFFAGLDSGKTAPRDVDVRDAWLKSITRAASTVSESIEIDMIEGWLM
ncbi:MAG: cobyric acid synthase [Candidatus Hydrothermarchaeales archaeon]